MRSTSSNLNKLNKQLFHFSPSLRFEIFFAIQSVLNQNSKIHQGWRAQTRNELSRGFFKSTDLLGNCAKIWPFIADVLEEIPGDLSFQKISVAILDVPLNTLQKKILTGAIHSEKLAIEVIEKKSTLGAAIAKLPKLKHEWLAFIGLYPYEPHSEMGVAMELLINDPKLFREAVVNGLNYFWNDSFYSCWKKIQPDLELSAQEKLRLFETMTFSEFSQSVVLRVEVNETEGKITAGRGGAELPFSHIKQGFFFPSVFNEDRFWTTYSLENQYDIYFPYFEPSISLEPHKTTHFLTDEAQIDAFQLCKAMGDPTRYAILQLIAKQKMSAGELAKVLHLSKPTISHHVHILREASLIHLQQTSGKAGAVILSPQKEMIQRMGEILIQALFKN